MVKQQDSELPYQLFEDQGSDPATPATGFSRLFTKSDGAYHIDDAGTVTGPFAESTVSTGVIAFDEVFYTGGDIAVTATAAGTAVPTIGALTLAGTAGDILAISISTRITDSDAQSMRIDVKLSGSADRFLSSRTSTADALGVAGWFGFASTATAQISGTVYIELEAGDLTAGDTTVTMCAWLSSSGSRPLAAGTNGPLIFQAINLGQP